MTPKYIDKMSLGYRIQYLDKNLRNAWKFYMIGYINKMINHKNLFSEETKTALNFYGLKNLSKGEVVTKLYNSFTSSKYRGLLSDIIDNKYYTWDKFYKDEIKEARNTLEYPLILKYIKFLEKCESKVHKIGSLGSINSISTINTDFEKYAKSQIGEGFIELKQVSRKISDFIDRVDEHYENALIYEKETLEEDFQMLANRYFFPYRDLASPTIFIEYPTEFAKYKRLYKNWLLMLVEKRKRILKWDPSKIPPVYKALVNYAESLLRPNEIEFFNQDVPQYYNYPKHIFPSLVCFKLFDQFAKNQAPQVLINYLYRKFQNSKNYNYRIEHSPRAFLDWYHDAYPENELISVHSSLSKVRSKDREVSFAIVKSLIEQLYGNKTKAD